MKLQISIDTFLSTVCSLCALLTLAAFSCWLLCWLAVSNISTILYVRVGDIAHVYVFLAIPHDVPLTPSSPFPRTHTHTLPTEPPLSTCFTENSIRTPTWVLSGVMHLRVLLQTQCMSSPLTLSPCHADSWHAHLPQIVCLGGPRKRSVALEEEHKSLSLFLSVSRSCTHVKPHSHTLAHTYAHTPVYMYTYTWFYAHLCQLTSTHSHASKPTHTACNAQYI